jgi:translation initiation factor 2A
VSCEWCNDGRHIMTCVLNPRMRVDNHFKIFKYNGELIKQQDFSETELYEIIWRPDHLGN